MEFPSVPLTDIHELLEPGRNCWRAEKASFASVLIDYANYYQALYQAIQKARHSIFVLGWDIDSRIELVRGEKDNPAPVTFFELIQWKVRQNPDMKIYLNRWRYTLFFAGQREWFAGFKWRLLGAPNVYYVMDNQLPLGACHHQKVIVIDDEIAFCGGMDIAIGRWDYRKHYTVNPERSDPVTLPQVFGKIPYGPYHDIQTVVAGPVAKSLASLVRERWKMATGYDPIPLRQSFTNGLPPTWPTTFPPDFEKISVGIARTLPPFERRDSVQEIEPLYLDEIAQAEEFIYIENQFLTYEKVAVALNKQLRCKPKLRVLAVSCDVPEGVMEKKAMWTARAHFLSILKKDVADRVVLAFPVSREAGREHPVRIHSKLMVVDDRFLHIGSSNLNHRSMKLDTECDLVFVGRSPEERAKIAAIRTDLIREHTGREAVDIEATIKNGAPVEFFLRYLSTSRQHLFKINDEKYTLEAFSSWARKIADPDEPLLQMPKVISSQWPRFTLKRVFWFLVALFALGLCIYSLENPSIRAYFSPQKIMPLIEAARRTGWGVPLMIAIFTVASLLLFPVTALIAFSAIVFGSAQGLLIAVVGGMMSAALGFLMGRKTRLNNLRSFFGPTVEKINQYLTDKGIVAVAAIRLVPLAPYTVVNIALGISNVSFGAYMAGTFLAKLPGFFAVVLLGDSMMQILTNPNVKNLCYLGAVLVGWGGMVLVSQKIFQWWQNKRKSQAP